MNTQLQNKIYDTIVIGAGISGISTACHLKKYSPKANFLILEGRQYVRAPYLIEILVEPEPIQENHLLNNQVAYRFQVHL